MEYIHVKNLAKYQPGYTDRRHIWAKIYYETFLDEAVQGLCEIDRYRFWSLIIFEVYTQKPVPLTSTNLKIMGWDKKKRAISLSLQMLHTLIEVRNVESKPTVTQIRIEESRVEKSRIEEKFVPPKIEEIIKYIQENPELSNIDPQDFFKGYSDGGWIDTQGKPVRNWKLKLRTRSKFEAERNPSKICYLCGKPATKYRTEMGKRQYICNECLPKEAPKRLPPKRKDKELVTRDKAQEQISKLAESMDSS